MCLEMLCWIDHVWSSKVCASSICSVCVFVSEVFFSFKSLRTGTHVFALLMVFLCVIWYTMWLLLLYALFNHPHLVSLGYQSQESSVPVSS